MTRMFTGLALAVALAVGATTGCQSPSGGGYSGSNSHAGHNH